MNFRSTSNYPREFMLKTGRAVFTDEKTRTRFYAPLVDPRDGEYIFRYPSKTGFVLNIGDIVQDANLGTLYRIREIAVQRANSASGRLHLQKA